MYCFSKDCNLLRERNTNCDQISSDIKKELNSKPVYKRKLFLKTKVKSYSDEATDFRKKEVPKGHSNYTCLVVISLGSILKRGKNKG